METLLISACLYGVECKYSGGSNALPDRLLEKLREKYKLIPVCPEVAAGLPIPRNPSERVGDRVLMNSGRDVTAEYHKGAEIALRLCELYGCRKALLQARSPSCGSKRIYDGSFSGTLTDGNGVCAELLKVSGITVINDPEIELIL